MTPCRRTDSASPEAASASKRRRGWRGFGWIASTGISSSSEGTGWPPIRTSRPRPKPRRCGEDSGALDKLHRHLPVGVGSGRATVVGNRGKAVARRRRERVHRQRAERRRAVEEDEVVAGGAGGERVGEVALPVVAAGELDNRSGEIGLRRDEIEIRKRSGLDEVG